MKITRFALAAVLWIGLLAATRAATLTYYVATNGTGNGTTWALATSNIQAAVTSAVDGDIVLVSNGAYYCWAASSTSGYTSMVTVTKAITIQSVNGPSATIVDGNYPFFTNRCFYISSGAILSGFTITNGNTPVSSEAYSGGGVLINTSGTLTNCLITGNSVTNTGGAGVYASGGLIVDCVISNNFHTNNLNYVLIHAVYINGGCLLTNCTIISNQCGGLALTGNPTVDTCRIVGNVSQVQNHRGAGIYARPANKAIVRNSTISYNVLAVYAQAAGIYQEGGGIISNCVISNNFCTNSAGGSPAGIQITAGSLTALVQNCTIVGNCTYNKDNAWGGGVYITKNGILRNCLIANNYAHGGGGIHLDLDAADNATSIENCTIVSNRAGRTYASAGGGINCAADSTGRVVNSIIYSNICYAAGYNNWNTNTVGMTFINCCTTPPTNLPGSGTISNEPAFVNFSAGNFRLMQSSPCINAGTNLDWMPSAVDLDWHRRLDGFSGRPDIGCYEFVPAGTMFRVR